MKVLLRVNFEILHKTKKKDAQLVKFALFLKLYIDVFPFFKIDFFLLNISQIPFQTFSCAS